MARYRHFALLIVFLIAACVTADPDPQPTEIPLDSVTSETQSGVLSSAAPAEPIDDSQAAHRAPSKNEIRLIQTRMRESGFDSGPIDGVMGPKTKAALHRFQSGCASLKDLLETSLAEDIQPTGGTETPKLVAAVVGLDEIRIVQTRVKAAGFNPGPIDGVLGAKTRSALLAIQSGCALVKTFPLVSRQEVQTGEKPAASALPSRTRPQLAVFPSGRPSEVITANKAASNSAGDEIQLVQVRLKEAGFDPGPIDGIMGRRRKPRFNGTELPAG
ncbi:MAG TPA: peptidoglycan-binding protein [Candidatus Udaeobacter sp.]|nr:peptidoglycan-binding protein [Candidatus Udaeobacter sp.]